MRHIQYLIPFWLILISSIAIGQSQLGNDIYGDFEGDRAGYSVALSDNGEILVVGYSRADAAFVDGGLVRVFRNESGEWVQYGQDLIGAFESSAFGTSVTISADGTRIAVGADTPDLSADGYVQVYEFQGQNWVQVGEDLTISYVNFFADNVDLSSDGNRIAVNNAGGQSNNVFVFEWNGTEWIRLSQVARDSGIWSVSISGDGNKVVYGTATNNVVQVYEWQDSIWVELGQELEGEGPSDRFGESVSLSHDGNRLIAGAISNRGAAGTLSGHARVFELQNSTWVQLGEDIDPEMEGDRAGRPVTISKDGQVVALSSSTDIGGENAGDVRVFKWNGISWEQVGSSILGQTGDTFSTAISLSEKGDKLAIGSPNNDINGSNAGRVRVFSTFSFSVLVNNASCIGLDNGSVFVSTQGAFIEPGKTLSYELYDEAGTLIISDDFGAIDGFPIENLAEGNYVLDIIDAGSIIYSERFTINEIVGSVFEIVDITTRYSINGLSNGLIRINLAGGTPNYTYTWSGPSSGTNASPDESLVINSLLPGTYTVSITDTNGNAINREITLLDETFPEETCNEPLDIIILNDSSGSVDATEYKESKEFFVNLCNALNIGIDSTSTRVAIAEWSSTGQQRLKIPITGDLPTLQNYNSSSQSFRNGTNPNSALMFGYNYLESNARDNATRVILLSTDGSSSQISTSLIALSETYQAEGYVVGTIAFDNAFNNGLTRDILTRTATLDQLAPGASAYSELNESLAFDIVNLYVCPLGPSILNTINFNKDGRIDITDYSLQGDCNSFQNIEVAYSVTALQQLSFPAGTPITFYQNDPRTSGGIKLLTTFIPCVLEAGDTVDLTALLPVSSPGIIWAVLNDDGSSSPPFQLPSTNIEELVYINNYDFLSVCVDEVATVSVFKSTSTPVPICDNTVINTLDVCNISNIDATGVIVMDEVPSGFTLVDQRIDLNGCAVGTSDFDIPVGCCMSIVTTYNVDDAVPGLYAQQGAELSGPANQVYINFNGASSTAEDIFIGDTINCNSDQVLFELSVNANDVCDDGFITCTFEIYNMTAVDLQNLVFSSSIPTPAIWASEPYFLEGPSIGVTNITGTNTATFTISNVPADSISTFNLDIFLGDWDTSGPFGLSAFLDGLPDFVNGASGQTLTSNAEVINVNAGPAVMTELELTIVEGDTVMLEAFIVDGTDPIWTTDGDGTFDDPMSFEPIYIPGVQDIENGTVILNLEVANIDSTCSSIISFVTVTIEEKTCSTDILSNESIEACLGETIIVFGIPITTNGTFVETFLTPEGCDSTHTVVVKFIDEVMTSEAFTLCEGESITVFGMDVSASGTFSNTFATPQGCDSTHTVRVDFIDEVMTSEAITLCEGESITVFGMDVFSSGTFSNTFVTQQGCDSTHTVRVDFIDDVMTTSEAITLCEGESITVFGMDVFSSGTFSNTFVSSQGCDSTHTVRVDFIDEVITSEAITLCEGESITVFGMDVSSSGTFSNTFTSASGCDSIHQVTLLVLDTKLIVSELEVCEGDTIEVLGTTVTSSGFFEEILESTTGCDSINQINVLFIENKVTDLNIVLIENDSIVLNGITYNTAGSFSQNLTTAAGCDSILRINVTRSEAIAHYDFDDCAAIIDISNSDYSEFISSVNNELDCGTISRSNIFRNDPEEFWHSCTSGINESLSMCTSSYDACMHEDNNPQAIHFNVLIDPEDNKLITLSHLSFYQLAPLTFDWINGDDGENNYPTLYGLRILKNGVEVYKEIDIRTSTQWTKESFDLYNIPDFTVEEESLFEFELLAYCLVGNGLPVSAWDLDDLSIYAYCADGDLMSDLEISGYVETEGGRTIMDVEVRKNQFDSPYAPVAEKTDSSGHYAFKDVAIGNSYFLEASKNDNPLNGVNTNDLIIIRRHILGIELIESQSDLIAADVNNDNVINGLDLIELRKLILGIYDELPANPSWKFYEKEDKPSFNAFSYEENIVLSNLSDDMTTADFIGVKIGDVNGSVILDPKVTVQGRSHRERLHLAIENIKVSAGDKIIVPVRIKEMEQVAGIQLSLLTHGLLVSAVVPGSLEQNNFSANIKDNKVNLSWHPAYSSSFSHNEILFYLDVEARYDGMLSELLELSNHSIKSEAYIGPDYNINDIVLLSEEPSSYDQLEIINTYPNPFSRVADVEFWLPTDSEVKIKVHDASGKERFVEKLLFSKGVNTWSLDADRLSQSGVLIVTLESNSGIGLCKLIYNKSR